MVGGTRNHSVINRICAIYILCWVFVPPLQVGNELRLIVVICAVVWFFTALIQDGSFLSKNSRYLLFCFITTVAILLLRSLAMPIGEAFTRTLQWIIFILIGTISLFYKDNDQEFQQILSTILLLLIAYYSITTIIADINNPYASRIANSEWLDARFEGNENVGTYGFIYLCVFLEPCLVYLIKSKVHINRLFDLLARIDSVVIAILVFVSGYSLALACFAVMCFIVLLINDENRTRIFILVILLLIFLMFYKNILSSVLDVLSDFFSDNIVWKLKFDEFKLMLTTSEQTGDLAERIKNYTSSINTIKTYPIFGCYIFGTGPQGGGHSFILDSFATLGVVVGFSAARILSIFPHKLIGESYYRNVLNYSVGIVWFLFLILDPFSQEMGITMFFLYPYIQRECISKRNIVCSQ